MTLRTFLRKIQSIRYFNLRIWHNFCYYCLQNNPINQNNLNDAKKILFLFFFSPYGG